jgi:hypothetical protein
MCNIGDRHRLLRAFQPGRYNVDLVSLIMSGTRAVARHGVATSTRPVLLPQKARRPDENRGLNRELKTELRQVLEKLDDPNKWTPEEKAWFSSWPELLPKKLRRLGELLQVPLSLCVVLPYYAIAVALFTLFLLIPSLIANVLVDAWKKKVVGSQSFGQ